MTGTAIYYFIERWRVTQRWQQSSAPIYSEDDAKGSLARARAKLPSEGFRLIKRTITDQVIEP